MLDLLRYGFMLRALAASILVGVTCSTIGVFVILRGLAFIGAGIAHAAFAGVTLGFLVGVHPLALAILFALGMVWVTGIVSQRGEIRMDAAIGIFFSLTMALAILFIGLMPRYNAEIYGYLFGNILGVQRMDLLLIGIMSGVVLATIFLLFKEFYLLTFDEETAMAIGLPTRPLFFLLLTLIAFTVVISLKAVGVILVFALIVIPAASAHQLTHSIYWMTGLSALFGASATFAGLIGAAAFDLPSGASSVLLAGLIFGVCAIVSPKRRTCEVVSRQAEDEEIHRSAGHPQHRLQDSPHRHRSPRKTGQHKM